LAPIFGGDDPEFCSGLLARFTVYWQCLVEVRLPISVCEAWQWIRMQNYVGWEKWRSSFKPVVDQSSCRFWTM